MELSIYICKKVESVMVLASSVAITDNTSAVDSLCRRIFLALDSSDHINTAMHSAPALTELTDPPTITETPVLPWNAIHE